MNAILQRADRVAGRAFSDPEHTERDLEILTRLRSACATMRADRARA